MKRSDLIIMALVIILDQALKAVIRATLPVGGSRDLIGSIMAITHVENPGAAFGIMKGSTVLLLVVTAVFVVIGVIFLVKNREGHWTMHAALSLVISGGVANMIDRILKGTVTDMFDFHFWPVFNIADIAVCVGCGLLIIYVLFVPEGKNRAKD